MTEIYELICRQCNKDKEGDTSDYVTIYATLYNGCVVCCDICKQPCAQRIKRVKGYSNPPTSQHWIKPERQKTAPKYRVIIDKLHEYDALSANSVKKHKEQKLAYIAELSKSVSDVQCRVESASHVYMLQYLDDETALITKHLPMPTNPELVGYYVTTKDKLGKHIDTQYNRYRGRANVGALTKAMHDMLTNLAKLKVMEYLTNDNH